MGFYLSPLVDVNEIDLSTTIPAVATNIAVTVLRRTWKGPELKTQFIGYVDELIQVFGEPTSGSYKDILSATGYLAHGDKLYCTRACPPSATFAGVYGTAASAMTFNQYTQSNAYKLTDLSTKNPDEIHEDTTIFDPGRPEVNDDMVIIANTRGDWGNYTKVCMCGKDVYNKVTEGTLAASAIGISEEMYDDIASVDKPFDPGDGEGLKDFLIIVKSADQQDIKASVIPYNLREVWLVSTDEGKIDDEGKNLYAENVINNESQYIRIVLRETLKNTTVNEMYTTDYKLLGGGYLGPFGAGEEDQAVIENFDLFANAEEIDVNIFIDSDKSDTVKAHLISICEDRMDSIAVLDCHDEDVINKATQETDLLRTWRRVTFNPNTSYAAVYGNWLEIYDKWAAKYRWIPSSGHVAGIYAYTDETTDPWFAPAGLNRAVLKNVRRLAWNPKRSHRDILYKNGINPLVAFAGQGKVVWGQKTLLDKSSAFNRVNVRRLFMVLEKAISTAARYFLFEPNDEVTRLLLINMIEPYLRDVKSRRGIYDFAVVCDSRNNTPERIDRNELWCDIYIKPVRSAEFIVLNFIATKTSAVFSELIASRTAEI